LLRFHWKWCEQDLAPGLGTPRDSPPPDMLSREWSSASQHRRRTPGQLFYGGTELGHCPAWAAKGRGLSSLTEKKITGLRNKQKKEKRTKKKKKAKK